MNKKFEFILEFSSAHTKIFKTLDRRLSAHGIFFSEYQVMHQLSKAPQRVMRRIDLAENIGMSASGITRLLNPMEKLNIVQKEQNARDARVSLVKLTEAGQTLLDDATTSILASVDEQLELLDDNNIEIFLKIMKKIR